MVSCCITYSSHHGVRTPQRTSLLISCTFSGEDMVWQCEHSHHLRDGLSSSLVSCRVPCQLSVCRCAHNGRILPRWAAPLLPPGLWAPPGPPGPSGLLRASGSLGKHSAIPTCAPAPSVILTDDASSTWPKKMVASHMSRR